MTFKEQLEADLPIFFNVDEFATPATYKTATVNVHRFVESNDFGDMFYTRIVGKVVDFLGIAVGDLIDVDGKSYAVVSFRPDEFNNMIEVFLNE